VGDVVFFEVGALNECLTFSVHGAIKMGAASGKKTADCSFQVYDAGSTLGLGQMMKSSGGQGRRLEVPGPNGGFAD